MASRMGVSSITTSMAAMGSLGEMPMTLRTRFSSWTRARKASPIHIRNVPWRRSKVTSTSGGMASLKASILRSVCHSMMP